MAKRVHYAWIICAACFIIMIFTAPLVNACASLYLTEVTKEFGISRSAFTMTNTIVAMCGMVLAPFWGRVYQKYSARLVLSASLVGFALGYMSYSIAGSLIQLYFSAFLVGVFYQGCAFLPVSMLITSWFDSRRGLAMSISLGGIGIGGSLLSPLISSLIMTQGWRNSYRLIGLMVMIIAVPTAFLLLRGNPEDMHLEPFKSSKESGAPKEQKEENSREVEIGRARKKPYFYLHLMGMFFLGVVCSAPLRQISPYVEDLHGAAKAALIVSLYSFIGIFGKLLLGMIHDRFGSMKGTLVAFGLMILGFLCLLFGKYMGLLYLMAVFYGIGNGVGTVSAPLVVGATFGKKNFNLMRGLTQSPMQLGMSLGGLMLALTYDVTGSYGLGWIGCIVLCIISAMCFLYAYGQVGKE